MRRPVKPIAVAALAALALSSCGFDGAQSLPLPGAAGVAAATR